MLQHNPELKSQIDQLWNKFWAGGISNPLTAIEQITYLLFMKRLDELDLKNSLTLNSRANPIYPDLKGPGCRRNTGIKKRKTRNPLRSIEAPFAGPFLSG